MLVPISESIPQIVVELGFIPHRRCRHIKCHPLAEKQQFFASKIVSKCAIFPLFLSSLQPPAYPLE
jgi:hypothetical protein